MTNCTDALTECREYLDAVTADEWEGEPGYEIDGALHLSPAPTPWDLIRSAFDAWFQGLVGRRPDWEWRRVPTRHRLPAALKRKYGVA